ncbi:MAG TPA: hypothetical protein VEJ63_17235 [Planctomycetota bacterium]|nr:hypothetical protein [Planctomycetota bacterium]
MVAELMLTLLLISSVCAAGMAIVALEYMENVTARESSLMKYGVCIQIWSFMVLCVLHFEFPTQDFFIHLMPVFTLIGAGVFMLGAISVTKAMERAKAMFAALAAGIQVCVITFLAVTTYLVP